MAIDTASRRLASLDFEEVWAEAVPIPDGTVGTADRWHSVWSYYQYYQVTYTGLRSTAIKREISFDVDNRPVMYKSRAILLESGIGSWLFEDSTTMVWEILTGDEGEVKRELSGAVQ